MTGGDAATPAPVPAPPMPVSGTVPWPRIAVGTPGPEFEPRPPGPYSYDHPDTECDGWSTSALTLRFASVRGAKHRYYRQPRQDAARAAAHQPTGAVVFAVADGVSSAVASELGAVEACRAAMERLLHLLSANTEPAEPLDLAGVVHHAAQRLWEITRWRLEGREPELADVAGQHATTLVAGAVRPASDGPAMVELCRIGDSAAWVLDSTSAHYASLFRPKTAPDAVLVSNEVVSLPQVPHPLEQVRVPLQERQVLLVGTDGVADPLGDGDGQVGSLFAGQLAAPCAPLWFAHVLDFSRETFDDDRTLLAIWPQTSERR
ncbi:protein phosphatase 2C domain-containing protein [Spongiactinospora rosea]|nr:protein phosphatase 2C domain-containing protein [Spongiactinospora rosea]